MIIKWFLYFPRITISQLRNFALLPEALCEMSSQQISTKLYTKKLLTKKPNGKQYGLNIIQYLPVKVESREQQRIRRWIRDTE